MSSGPEPVPPDHSTGGEPRQVVRSSDQVALHLPIAGPSSRILAYALDLVLIWVALGIVLLGLFAGTALVNELGEAVGDWLRRVGESTDPEAFEGAFLLGVLLIVVLGAVAEIAYFLFWDLVGGGRSPGKALFGLRVMRDGGLPIDLRASLIRNLLRLADVLPANYLTGLIAMLVSRDGKRLGDLAAGSIVVRQDRPLPAPPLALEPTGGDEAFRFDRGQLARLGRNERALARQTLRRLDALDSARAEAALARAVQVLAERLDYADEIPAAEREAFLRALLRVGVRR